MRVRYKLRALGLIAAAASPLQAQTLINPQARISVDATQVLNRVSALLYGSCIEDVNHEIYGGLYDQKIFGESFEEPPPAGEIVGWTTLGGTWNIEENDNQSISVNAVDGAKLVRLSHDLKDGQAEVNIKFPNRQGDNAGLLLRVQNAGMGADNFDGYEISLSAARQTVLLGKHRHDWKLLREVSVPIAVNQWQRLRVIMNGSRLQIFVNENPTPLIDFTDSDRPFLNGAVALRTWKSDVTFQDLRIDGVTASPFQQRPAPSISSMWDALPYNDSAFLRDGINPYNGAFSQMIHHGGGQGTAGIANRGLNRWGIAVRRGQPLTGRLYLRAHDLRGPLTVALQNADGTRTYATQKISKVGNKWAQYSMSLLPQSTDNKARFALWIDRPGTLWVDQVTLGRTGAARFKGLPFRADIGAMMQQQGLTFLRYGGTMVNAPEYRWKKMIGDPDRRPPYRGHWYPYSTNAFGIEEFLQFCEAAGFEPSFAINVEETAQDAADLVEYLNGPVTSLWGRRRAQNGHPRPYNVRYIEIGNEEVIWGDNAADYEHYIQRFIALHDAMKSRDSKLQLINAAWWRPDSPNMEKVFKALDGKAAYWDLHPWADNPNAGREVDALLTGVRALFQKWNPVTTMKVAILEENGGLHNMQRALGHATILNAVRRHGDFVLTSCPANGLQPLGQNDNGWDQGQIFFTPAQVWGMPPFYAQQMAARNHLPLRVESRVEGPLDATATRSEDGKTLLLHVVNSSADSVQTHLQFQGIIIEPSVQIEQLAAPLNAVNSADKPTLVQPRRSTWEYKAKDSVTTYTFAPHSFTILRFASLK